MFPRTGLAFLFCLSIFQRHETLSVSRGLHDDNQSNSNRFSLCFLWMIIFRGNDFVQLIDDLLIYNKKVIHQGATNRSLMLHKFPPTTLEGKWKLIFFFFQLLSRPSHTLHFKWTRNWAGKRRFQTLEQEPHFSQLFFIVGRPHYSSLARGNHLILWWLFPSALGPLSLSLHSGVLANPRRFCWKFADFLLMSAGVFHCWATSRRINKTL